VSLTGHGDRIRNLAWSPDGAWIATASYDHDARIWDAETGELMATLTGHADSVYSVAWSPDGARVATSSNDRTFRVWDITH
jgi:WD40 repeat protein